MDLNSLKVAELKSLCEALGVKPGAKKADSISAITKLGLSEEDLNKRLEELGISASAPKAKKSSAKAKAETVVVSIPPEFEARITALENRVKEIGGKITEIENSVKSLANQPKSQAAQSNVDLGTIQFILKKLQDIDRVLYSKNKSEEDISQDDIEQAKANIEEAFSNAKNKSMTFDELMDRKEMRDVSWYAVLKAVEELVEDEFVQVSEGSSIKKYKDKYGRINFMG
jgi:hypothetical protein